MCARKSVYERWLKLGSNVNKFARLPSRRKELAFVVAKFCLHPPPSVRGRKLFNKNVFFSGDWSRSFLISVSENCGFIHIVWWIWHYDCFFLRCVCEFCFAREKFFPEWSCNNKNRSFLGSETFSSGCVLDVVSICDSVYFDKINMASNVKILIFFGYSKLKLRKFNSKDSVARSSIIIIRANHFSSI